KPKKTAITFTPKKAAVGRSVVISCESYGVPKPSYTIIHNDSLVSTEKAYTISGVSWSDTGSYQCIAENKLGQNSKCSCLTVVGDAATSKKVDCGSSAETVVIWHIVVSLMSGVIIGVFLAYIVLSAHRRWFRNRKPQKYCEPQETEVDTTYQELDLSKMNTEDNYQSLRVNAANNDD
ncbi:brother of CDO, partial [Paramuricea clavata]